ncbi:MAG: MBOAT family O-acyltransferase [Bacteroidales bacterium]|nr:MBOAT family O-acyltransferase [Bacteroidales bacterium]
MGGEDAIVRWRAENPPLAANDYTHISYAGGHKLAELMYQDLFSPDTSREVVVDPLQIESEGIVSDTLTTPSSTLRSGHPSFQKEGKVMRIVKTATSFNPEKPLIFTTAAFWIFLLALLLIYSIIAGKPLIRNTYLFLFSLLFYYKSGGAFFILLIISTLTDYAVGLLLSNSGKKGIRKLLVFASLLVNLGMLAYYKYTFFITRAINDIAETSIPEQNWLAILANRITGSSFDVSSIILPIGISFFTFQTISYTLDVYRGKTKAVKNILDFGFYVSFFPQLVAGPIVRASEFIPQLYQKFALTKREWSHALFLIVSGLIKKIIVSDFIATSLVDKVFASPGIFSGLENLLAVYGYGLQIYCDFSGYTDIAIGVALMLGFRLPVNFNSPYKAVNISDFWRRWHISLSRWLKDYLYISLGGNRKGRIRTGINLLITMLLGGLWHGAAWRFIIWGGLHGAGLMLHKFWSRVSPFRKKSGKLGRFIGIFITFNFVSFCWIFFRAENMDSVSIMLERITSGFKGIDVLAFIRMYYGVLVVMLGGYVLHFMPARIKESYRGLFILTPLVLKLVIVYIIALALYNFQTTDIQPFIYFRF